MALRPLPFRSPAIAKHVLAHAAQNIDQPQNIVAVEVYTATAEYWQTYIRMLGGRKLGPQDVLNMLGDLAKVKSVIGQGDVAANYIEAATCVAGAAVMANAQFVEGGSTTQQEPAAGTPSEPPQTTSAENGGGQTMTLDQMVEADIARRQTEAAGDELSKQISKTVEEARIDKLVKRH